MPEIILEGGEVLDGSGKPRFRADIAIERGRILAVGDLKGVEAGQRFPAHHCFVAPGFIDLHSHADLALLARPGHEEKLLQGVTTEVFSNCGLGFAPVNPAALTSLAELSGSLFGSAPPAEKSWTSVRSYLELLHGRTAVNVAYLVPHAALRISSMGPAPRPATPNEIALMCQQLERAFEEGARGWCTGLHYAPLNAATTEEIQSLCRVAAARQGLFAIHLRDYYFRLFESIEEALDAATVSGVRLQLSHYQAPGKNHLGRQQGERLIEKLTETRSAGIDVCCDVYPYTAGSTLLSSFLPPAAAAAPLAAALAMLRDPFSRAELAAYLEHWPHEWSRVMIAGVEQMTPQWEGVSIFDAANQERRTIGDFVCELLLQTELRALGIFHQQDEADMHAILQSPYCQIGSDGLHIPGKPHPRLYGTFPRVLGHFVRETGLLGWEEAVRKMTGASADRLRLPDRGRIMPGMAADVVVFDPQTVLDRATYESPRQFPQGIRWVFVNGQLAARAGEPTRVLAGRVLTQ